ncbi:MAG: hypothetical protein U0234_27945 [Sandaracinus sp.]
MSERWEELGRTGAVLYGAVGGIWVMILHAPSAEADMRAAGPALAKMRELEPKGFPSLTWVLSSAGLSMDGPARRAAAEVTDAYAQWNIARATLIEGKGFQAATVRAIVSGIDMLSRAKSPTSVHGHLDESVAWCVAHRAQGAVDRTTPPDVIVRALHAARAGVGG